MKEFLVLQDDLTAQRHDRLRRVAPAVQHEINNAMMVLASNLELLGRSVGDGAPRRQLDRALEATRRLDEAMRGFLDAARRPVTEEAAASPAQALRQVLPVLRVALGARHGIDVTVPEGIWNARLDRARLDMALLALVQDAQGQMQPGARVGIALANAGTEVTLAVALPEGVAPSAAAQALLAEAATATGGRIDAGPVLAWPKA
jgi:signal transduction histidine kinase